MLFESKRNADARQEMKLRTAASALIVVAALVFGGGLFMMGAHASGLIKTTGAYTTTRLVPGTYSNTIECNGSVMPIRVTDVDTKAKGSVTVVHVRDGQYVKQGTVLFEMRDGQDEPQVITASVAGTVTNLKVAVGMTSDQLAQQGPALQIADMNVLIGVVQTPEYVSVLLEAGQYVSITSTVTPGVRYQGMLTGLLEESLVVIFDEQRSGALRCVHHVRQFGCAQGGRPHRGADAHRGLRPGVLCARNRRARD